MKFLIQSHWTDLNQNLPIFPWQVELINSLKYQNLERSPEERHDYSLVNNVRHYTGMPKKSVRNCVPVGSVEFVHEYFQRNDIPVPDPVNIPEDLFELSGLRPVVLNNKYGLKIETQEYYYKSCTQIKHPENGLHKYLPEGKWLVTENLKEGFDAEFRCFVFNGHLLDVKPYCGDWWSYYEHTDELLIYVREAINLYKEAPPAYTIDVGLYQNELYIIELHNFYSCGLYGFSWPNHYPQMLSQWYVWWIRKNEKTC